MPYAALAVTIVLWASAFAWIRAALESYSAGHLSVLRLAIAALVLAAIAAARGVRLPARRDVPAILFVAFAGMTAYQVLLNAGEQTVPAATASLLVNLSPIFTALAATALLHERLTRTGWAGIALAFTGAAAIALAGHGGFGLHAGALLVIGAAVAQAAFFVAQKPLLRRYSSLELTTWAMVAGTIMALPLAPGLPQAIAEASARSTIAVLLLALGSSAVGFVCWAYAVGRIEVSIAAATLYAVPLVATGVGWIWLGELPSLLTCVGGTVALGGVVLTTTRGRPGGPPPVASQEPARIRSSPATAPAVTSSPSSTTPKTTATTGLT
jgi:drug/metabolite transporter (DMT)-like permease